MPLDNSFQILVVDDVPANLSIVRAILQAQGYRVVEALNAQEVYQALESHPIDLILLDVMMPEVNGFEVSKHLKTLPGMAEIPIIFLTALSEKDQVIQGFAAGGVDYVAKPFNKTELLMRVKTHLTLEQTRRDLREKNLILERTATELREANLARDKFVSILAHDLKNPMSGIMILVAEILKNLAVFTLEDLQEVFETLHQSSKNVYTLLETLLAWGQTQTGTLVLQFKNLSIPEVLSDSILALEQNIHHKNLAVIVDTQAKSLWADQATLTTTIRNLLSNAVKYTPPGGQIRLSSWQDGPQIVLEVRDTGVGIKPELQAQLFRLDVKISTPGTEKELGTGLGLLLCKEFIEKNNGTIEVESQEGFGTAFRLRFPSAQEGDEAL